MKKDPARRLGGGKLGAEEVKQHPYFSGTDWNSFMTKTIPAPWKPQIVITLFFLEYFICNTTKIIFIDISYRCIQL